MREWQYDVHPGVLMGMGVVAKMKEKTGRSLEEWVALVQESGLADDRARAAWLKSEHGLGTNYAGWIVDRAAGRRDEMSDPEAYLHAAKQFVADMFSGPKAALLPIYDRLMELATSMGDDIRVSPGKTIVPIYRNHVIAQIKPSTRTRIDFGLALGDAESIGRLKSTGGFAKGDRITHVIAVSEVAEVDSDVAQWLREAYARDS